MLALELKKVKSKLFYQAKNLKTVVMPEAEEIASSAFEGTKVENCYFPKLRSVDGLAFNNCLIKSLDEESFPVL